ncbi:hypothetical protein NDU88_008335 [Pleurodeles waltl]|uniref:Uncharacterized protein n=1 Tax=Pleurodeles waltl TaxID=8319 RepID=A0AAV7PP81_PLEWA|nr:hypothetical protein NDU88_008335 [Pleurodeles waltl]
MPLSSARQLSAPAGPDLLQLGAGSPAQTRLNSSQDLLPGGLRSLLRGAREIFLQTRSCILRCVLIHRCLLRSLVRYVLAHGAHLMRRLLQANTPSAVHHTTRCSASGRTSCPGHAPPPGPQLPHSHRTTTGRTLAQAVAAQASSSAQCSQPARPSLQEPADTGPPNRNTTAEGVPSQNKLSDSPQLPLHVQRSSVRHQQPKRPPHLFKDRHPAGSKSL